ncbi:MAG TPA: DUF2461 family protein [Terriglobia bacterium]|nr:DUF2461 family protein [Terriglobia bacterium]
MTKAAATGRNGGFAGFTPESFRFFRDLERNNNKPWFDENRSRYDTHVTGAFRGLLGAIERACLRLNPHFETSGKTNGNFSRINRDIRFSKDKRPYKSNYYLRVYDARRSHHTEGWLYVGLSAEALTVGYAAYASWRKGERSALETVFRPRFQSHRHAFDRLLKDVVRKGRYETYWHRQEKGDWTQHAGLPRRDEDWLTLQAWIARKVFPPNTRGLASPAFAARVEQIFRELYPLYVFTSAPGPKWQAELGKSRGPRDRRSGR